MLWDYGWFDQSRFAVDGRCDSDTEVLAAFLKSPIAARSFCSSPDPWGADVGRHGPLLTGSCDARWFAQLGPDDFVSHIESVFRDSGFDDLPTARQRRTVDAWVDDALRRRDSVFLLSPPDDARIRVDWDVWGLFVEFLCLDSEHQHLAVGVIGYD
ncbi:MAG: hypothetical protein KDC98_18250 [Planctomycetes bacterium]|nr:hypothetical protein [Planctomycetota bacterium]